MASIPQADVLQVHALPVDAQRVVTKHRHVLYGEISGNAPLVHLEVLQGASTYLSYEALPIIHDSQHAQHGVYGATLFEDKDDGLDPFYLPADIPFGSLGESAGNITGTDYRGTNPPNAGSPTAFDTAPGDTFITYHDNAAPANYGQVFGFVLAYKAPWRLDGTPNYWNATNSPGFVRLSYENGLSPTSANYAQLRATYNIPRAEDPQVLIGIVPPAHIFSQWNQYDPLAGKSEDVHWTLEMKLLIEASTVAAFGDVEFVFHPLMKNVARLDAIGGNAHRIPAANPQQILVRGIQPPDRTHDFPGWPGGPLNVEVARQHYQEGDTLIDVEQIGPRSSGTGRLEGMTQIHDAIALRERIDLEYRRRSVALMLASRR